MARQAGDRLSRDRPIVDRQVMTKRPLISVIIALPPGTGEPVSLRSLRKVKAPPGGIEVLLARGTQPAAQRNRAVRRARGEIVYFLDDDAVVAPRNLMLLARHFREKDLAVAGGPDLRPLRNTWFELAVDLVQGSWLGSFLVRGRYRALALKRKAGEADLILCNMAFRRSVFLRQAGFNEGLYPNEENEFLNRLRNAGQRMLYDPRLYIRRKRPGNLWEFLRQSWRYGRGRSEQFFSYPCLSDLIHYVPAFFLLYLFAASLGMFGCGLARSGGGAFMIFAPVFLYLLLVVCETLVGIWESRLPAAPIMLLLYPGRHLAYALGTVVGLLGWPFRRKRRSEVRVERVRP